MLHVISCHWHIPSTTFLLLRMHGALLRFSHGIVLVVQTPHFSCSSIDCFEEGGSDTSNLPCSSVLVSSGSLALACAWFASPVSCRPIISCISHDLIGHMDNHAPTQGLRWTTCLLHSMVTVDPSPSMTNLPHHPPLGPLGGVGFDPFSSSLSIGSSSLSNLPV